MGSRTNILLSLVVAMFCVTNFCSGKPLDQLTQGVVIEVPGAKASRVEILEEEEVIIAHSVGRLADADQSVILQDYRTGFQSLKDVQRNSCYVFPTQISFATAKRLIKESKESEKAKNSVAYLMRMASREPIPQEMLSLAVGDHIAQFCNDSATYWLLKPHGEKQREKRSATDIVIITDDGYYAIPDERDIVIDTRQY